MYSPHGFDDYRELYPATPPLPAADRSLTEAFVAAWEAGPDAQFNGGIPATVLFVRGYLGNWMPGNLLVPIDELRARGIRAHLLPNRAGATIADNLPRLGAAADALAPEGPLIFAGHSKGGLEALALLDQRPDLAARTTLVLLSQTPRGPSAVLGSLLDRAHPTPTTRRAATEWIQRIGLHTIGAATGGRELVEPALSAHLARLGGRNRPYPVWQTASWSSHPTTWLDSFHERLGEIRPGAAHDGQFFLEDLVWPGIPNLLLPRLDHAQPAMGGHGFDHGRYWRVLLGMAADQGLVGRRP